MSQEKPFFSVVIPVYNKGPHINRCLSSVLNQTFQDYEVILINDASTDNSLEEIQKFNDSRIRIFHRDKPGPGGYAARNLGIEKARAEWVAFLDADDEWYPEHLEKMYDLLEYFPDANFLSCGWEIVNNNGEKQINPYYLQNNNVEPHVIGLHGYLTNYMNKKNPVCTDVVCAKRDLMEGIFPAGKASQGGDRYAWMLLLSKTDMVWSPNIGAIYHRDSVNMTTKTTSKSDFLQKEIIHKLNNRISRQNMDLLKKHSNRWHWRIHVVYRKSDCKHELKSQFFWKGDFLFCASRSLLSILPNFVFLLLLRKKRFKI